MRPSVFYTGGLFCSLYITEIKNLTLGEKMCNNEHCNCENCTCGSSCKCTAENQCGCE